MTASRRRFLETFGAAAIAGAVAPHAALARPRNGWPEGPSADEEFWGRVKAQFPVRPGLIMINAANLCPSPYPVIDTVTTLTRAVDEDASFQNRSRFGPLHQGAREALASHLGAEPNEVAITRNTSESNNTVVNGVALGRGDEVLAWDQNHPTNRLSWKVRSERLGYTVKEVSTPEVPRTEDELFDAMAAGVTPRTRVMTFSHVSNATGIRMPAARLCAFARERGILTLVDGAQSFGALDLDVHAIGCDFYTGSSHKWFLGPKEAGILYVRADQVDGLWATHVGVGWNGAIQNGARKFDNLGQRDDACVAAMGTAADLHRSIGTEVIEQRIGSLVAALRAGLTARVPGVRFTGPVNDSIRGGVLVVVPPDERGGDLYRALYREHNIAGAPRGAGVRFSPHIYNTMADIERVIDAVSRYA